MAGRVPIFPLVLVVVGPLDLVAAAHRFQVLMAIGCFAAAASRVLGFWWRSSSQPLDKARAPLAALLFVWAVGLYGSATMSAAGNAFDRVAAGLPGSLYVVGFADRVRNRLHRIAGGGPGAG